MKARLSTKMTQVVSHIRSCREFVRLNVATPEDQLVAALDPDTVTLEQYKAVVPKWFATLGPGCDGCGLTFEAVVVVGQEPDWDSSTARLCKGCLDQAHAMLCAHDPTGVTVKAEYKQRLSDLREVT